MRQDPKRAEEKRTRVIKLNEDDPKIFGHLLVWLYFDSLGLSLCPSFTIPDDPDSAADELVALYHLADKYEVKNIKDEVLRSLMTFINVTYRVLGKKAFFKMGQGLWNDHLLQGGLYQYFMKELSAYVGRAAGKPWFMEYLDSAIDYGKELLRALLGIVSEMKKAGKERSVPHSAPQVEQRRPEGFPAD
ncbi:MAG: hypothetical protein M1827_000487 [Pycnora praestabilis]|nr:MAG: hypothetical protein M1827_000487 [Pycnora praestabilis]